MEEVRDEKQSDASVDDDDDLDQRGIFSPLVFKRLRGKKKDEDRYPRTLPCSTDILLLRSI